MTRFIGKTTNYSRLYRKVCHDTKKGQMMSRIKLDLKKLEVVAVKLKLIILWCQFYRVFCQSWHKLFTYSIKNSVAHNLLIHKMRAEAERARGNDKNPKQLHLRVSRNPWVPTAEAIIIKKDKYKKQREIPTEPIGEERMRKIKFGGFTLCC